MTSRRRGATFTFSPDGGDDGKNRAADLERKLELLEARFTMPLHFPPQNHQNNSNNSNSPATLDAENSSPVSILSSTMHEQSHQHRNNDSRQSFAFDTPSLLNVTGHFHHDDSKGNVDHVPHKWEEIASAHVARVQRMHEFQNDSQQNTMQTSHVKEQSSTISPMRTTTIIKETDAGESKGANASTPPILSSPTVKNKKSVGNTTVLHQTTMPGEKKRKPSLPVKRPQPSVKDSLPANETIAATKVSGPTFLSLTSGNTNMSKRTRLNFDTAPLPTQHSNHQVGDDDTPSTLSMSRSPVSARPTIGTKSNSPRRNLAHSRASDKHVVDRDLVSSNSRDPINATIIRSAATKALAAITNNAKISDFFTITNRKRPKNSIVNDKIVGQDGTNENILSNAPTPVMKAVETHPYNRPLQSSTNRISLDNNSVELEVLKRKYDELQRVCHDKEEQLKAVANNRTILHTALQTALRQREQEFDALQQSSEEKDGKYRDALEELVRTDACQEARELREKLASDGARLGRITSIPMAVQKGAPRMLMNHRAALESWEDGYATKELQQKMKDLQAKKTVLEARQVEATRAREEYYSTMKNEIGQGGESGPDKKDLDNPTLSILCVREAVESVRYHLNTVRVQEREFSLAEQALNDEKGAHVRALKRVASEDASRFRTRPKLNDRYVLRSLLGKGGFSEVWLAFDLNELREVAVKIHQLDSRWPDAKKDNYTKHVSREYEIHRSVRHPRIVSLFDVFEIDNNSFATVLELCEGTDLDTLLKVRRRLPERDARAILLQILSGMNYLSHPSEATGRQGIIHYDLKPGNVLFDQYGDAKITDFGLSKIVDAHDPAESMELTSQGAGTYWYLPPECFVLEGNVRISNKVDVWSIGVIFYQMLFGKRPFGDGLSQDRMLANGTMLHAHTVTFPDRHEVSVSCKEFIEACLAYDQRLRPSIAQICEHSYIVACDDT